MLLDHPVVGRRVFHPRPASLEPSFFADSDGARLACYVRGSDPRAPTLLHFHGNGELASTYAEDMAPLFVEMGVNVCFAEYRGYGLSTGQPALAAMLADGEAVVSALGIPPERIVAFGRSLGSVYAIELARRLPRLAGLVLESGIAEVREVWPLTDELREMGRTEAEYAAEVATHLDHRQKLSGNAGPLLVLHAANDRLVPASHGERLHAWGAGTDKDLRLFERGDHNTVLSANFGGYTGALRAFLQRCAAANR